MMIASLDRSTVSDDRVPSLLYDASMQRVMPVFTSADRQSAYSEASDIADVIYTAATDGTDRLRYLAGKDAEAMSAERARMSDEEYALWAVKHFNL